MYIIQIQISIETLFEFLPPITTTSLGPHAEIRSRSVRNDEEFIDGTLCHTSEYYQSGRF